LIELKKIPNLKTNRKKCLIKLLLFQNYDNTKNYYNKNAKIKIDIKIYISF